MKGKLSSSVESAGTYFLLGIDSFRSYLTTNLRAEVKLTFDMSSYRDALDVEIIESRDQDLRTILKRLGSARLIFIFIEALVRLVASRS